MTDFLEAVVTLLPSDAGGRRTAVSPRDGSYCPFIRLAADGSLLRVRFIEGPPTLAPGDSDRVVLEVDSSDAEVLVSGAELELIEAESRAVGLVTVARLWRSAPAV